MENGLRRIRYGVLFTTMVALALAAAYAARRELLLIYAAGILAIGLARVVALLERRRWAGLPRWLAILVVYLGILGMLALAVLLVVPPLVEQARELWSALPQYLARAEAYLTARGVPAGRLTIREAVESVPADGSTLRSAASAVTGLAGGVIGVLLVFVLAFYFLVDAQAIVNGAVRLVPREHRPAARRVAGEVTDRVSAWLTSQVLVAAIVGVVTGVGLWLLGVPFFYVLALVSAIGEFIPYVGPMIAAVPAIALGLTESFRTALFVTIFFVALQQFQGAVLQPKIMGARLQMSPLAVLIGVVLAYPLLGPIGLILAVPTTAIVLVVAEAIGQVNGGTSGET